MIALFLSTLIVTATLVVAGTFAIGRWFPDQGTTEMYLAATVNLLAGWVAFIPLALVSRSRMTDYIPQAAMGAMVIRILIVAFALLAVMTWGKWDNYAVSIWMVVFYLALLVVETAIALRLVKRFYSSSESAQQ
ncbi:MAG: hypothetical protein DHS20C16_34330 [Phycisphaerae bacterium]|nr:MAG: hypothetical protein DHS20C16_34330 [Phycisphaerae bacterium]